MNDLKAKLARHLMTLSYAEGEFTLTSGRKSDYYFDCRQTSLHPEGAWLIGSLFNMMLADENQDIWLQSALYSPDMVEDAVDMALDILNGNAPEDPVKIIPTTILDRDTVESHLDENSPY